MQSTFIKLAGDTATIAITQGNEAARQGEQFHTLIGMIQQQNKMIEKFGGKIDNFDQRLTLISDRVLSIEYWKQDILGTGSGTPSIRRRDQAKYVKDATVKGLNDHFDMDGLKQIIFDMDFEPDDFTGKKGWVARQLVQHAIDKGAIWNLIRKCKTLRPHYPWPSETGPLS